MAEPRECGRCGAAESDSNPFQHWRRRCVPCHQAEERARRREYNKSPAGRAAMQRHRAKPTFRTWAQQHPERQQALRRAWKERNPDAVRASTNARRVRLLGAPGAHSEKDWQKLKARYGGLCYYCRESPATSRDHVIPLSRGGSDFIGNILPACGRCNSTKHNKTIMEWRVRKWRMDMAGAESPQGQRPRVGQAGIPSVQMGVRSKNFVR